LLLFDFDDFYVLRDLFDVAGANSLTPLDALEIFQARLSVLIFDLFGLEHLLEKLIIGAFSISRFGQNFLPRVLSFFLVILLENAFQIRARGRLGDRQAVGVVS